MKCFMNNIIYSRCEYIFIKDFMNNIIYSRCEYLFIKDFMNDIIYSCFIHEMFREQYYLFTL